MTNEGIKLDENLIQHKDATAERDLQEAENIKQREFNVVEHNTLIKEINKYKGVVTRSNFSDKFTDLNPSFNFERILKKIENE